MNTRKQSLLLFALVSLTWSVCNGQGVQGVFAQRFELDFPDPPHPLQVGTIPGSPGMYIHITQLGIGGEPDAQSGPAIFSVSGAGLDVSWGAGQEAFTATYALAPTQPVAGPSGARGFTYQPVSLFTMQWGEPLEVWALSSQDSDGLFTYAADSHGTFFDDSAFPGSSRVWIEYEYTAVPEPSTWALLGLGAVGLALARWRRK